MIGMPLTPTPSPTITLPRSRGREGWGQTARGRKQPLAPRERGEGGARDSGRVRGSGARHVVIMALLLLLALTGCGKRNAPEPPPDVPDTYPRTYPSE